MFIIVWVGAFPIIFLPLLQHTLAITLSEWVSRALREPGMPRTWAESVLIFVLMVIALILPIKSFLERQSSGQTNHYQPHEQTQ